MKDKEIERIVRSFNIRTMKEWRTKVDDDMLRRYGLRLGGKDLKPSRIRAVIRRLRKSPDRKRRNRPQKRRPYPRQ